MPRLVDDLRSVFAAIALQHRSYRSASFFSPRFLFYLSSSHLLSQTGEIVEKPMFADPRVNAAGEFVDVGWVFER